MIPVVQQGNTFSVFPIFVRSSGGVKVLITIVSTVVGAYIFYRWWKATNPSSESPFFFRFPSRLFMSIGNLPVPSCTGPNNGTALNLPPPHLEWLRPPPDEEEGGVPEISRDLSPLESQESVISFFPNVKELIETYQTCWSQTQLAFDDTPFDLKTFKYLLQENLKDFKERTASLFSTPIDPTLHFGYIEKRDLPEGSKIFVRADLHGDLKSLFENLLALHQEGYLDNDFKCIPGFYLVFLGDYSDRGHYALEVLRLLFTLRLENPNQVILIRGNHEEPRTHHLYTNEERLITFVNKHHQLLEEVYSTMPLTIYLSQQGELRQYVQFTHGLFELHVVPEAILNCSNHRVTMPVKRKKSLNTRFSTLTPNSSTEDLSKSKSRELRKSYKYNEAVERFITLWRFEVQRINPHGITTFNWGDVASDQITSLDDPGRRQWKLTPEDIKVCYRLFSRKHPIKFFFRGHQHAMWHHSANGKLIGTTLSIGMDIPGYSQQYPQEDLAYVLTTASKVRDWQKQPIVREAGVSSSQVLPPQKLREIKRLESSNYLTFV